MFILLLAKITTSSWETVNCRGDILPQEEKVLIN